MAKNDMIANHKRGFINSTVGNAFRGGLTGALVAGGIAAIATLATGGLALPIILGAAAAGAAVFGGLNALGGTIRWGAETVGGILGMNRKQRHTGVDDYGQEPQQQQSMGLAEVLTAAVGAAIGIKSMKNKLSNAFGKSDKEMDEPEFSPDFGQDAVRAHRVAGSPPRIPALLEDKVQYNEQGQAEFQLSRDDLADPKVRQAVANFGKAQIQHRNELHKHGGLEGKREAVQMQRAAMSVDENGQTNDALKPSFDRDAGVFTVRAEHLMNPDTQYAMVTEGRKHQQSQKAVLKQEERALNREMNTLSGAGDPFIRRTENPFRDASAPQQEAAAQEPSLQEMLDKQEVTPAMEAFAKNMKESVSVQQTEKKEAAQTTTPPAEAAGEKPDIAISDDSVKQLRDAKQGLAGVVSKGEVKGPPRAGTEANRTVDEQGISR